MQLLMPPGGRRWLLNAGHWGKIVLMWIAVGVVEWLTFGIGDLPTQVASKGNQTLDTFAVAMFTLIIFLPLFAFAKTWKWLSGKDKSEHGQYS